MLLHRSSHHLTSRPLSFGSGPVAPSQDTHLWKGIRWQTTPLFPSSPIRLLTVPEAQSDPTYRQSVQAFRQHYQEVLQHIQTTYPKRFLDDFQADFTIFPHAQFRSALKLDEEGLPRWVVQCIREGVMCFDHITPQRDQWPPIFSKMNSENKIKKIHEVLHNVHNYYIRGSKGTPGKDNRTLPTTFSEGLVETIPRFVMNIQQGFPQNTQFLLEEFPQQLILPRQIETPPDPSQDSYFQHSEATPQWNPAYASAMLHTMGLALTLHPDLKTGLFQLLDLAKANFQEGNPNLYSVLAKKLHVPEYQLLNTHHYQQLGLNYIQQHYASPMVPTMHETASLQQKNTHSP